MKVNITRSFKIILNFSIVAKKAELSVLAPTLPLLPALPHTLAQTTTVVRQYNRKDVSSFVVLFLPTKGMPVGWHN